MKIVGLFGFAGSGKDEAAKVLVKDGWQRMAFADALRGAALRLDPIVTFCHFEPVRLSEVVEDLGWDEAKWQYPEVRRTLQRLGTEAGRDIHGGDCWTKIVRRKLLSVPAQTPGVVFTDIRFPNEAALIRELRGCLIEIERPGVKPVNGHVSDNFEIEADITVRNDRDIKSLHETMRQIVGGKIGVA